MPQFFRKTGYTFLGLLCVALVSAGIATTVLNIEHENAKDTAVFGNLETIRTQSTISSPYAPFTAENCESGLFTEPTIASALLAIRIANGGGIVYCAAANEEFVVYAERPKLGFFKPSSSYWCADKTASTCPVASSDISNSFSCPCHLKP